MTGVSFKKETNNISIFFDIINQYVKKTYSFSNSNVTTKQKVNRMFVYFSFYLIIRICWSLMLFFLLFDNQSKLIDYSRFNRLFIEY